jgi:hypothetical protein
MAAGAAAAIKGARGSYDQARRTALANITGKARTGSMSGRIEGIESRLKALEEGGGSTPTPVDLGTQAVDTTTAPTASYTSGPVGNVAKVVGGTVGGINDAVPPMAQSVANDMMGEQFMRNLSVGAAKMISGKKINQ